MSRLSDFYVQRPLQNKLVTAISSLHGNITGYTIMTMVPYSEPQAPILQPSAFISPSAGDRLVPVQIKPLIFQSSGSTEHTPGKFGATPGLESQKMNFYSLDKFLEPLQLYMASSAHSPANTTCIPQAADSSKK